MDGYTNQLFCGCSSDLCNFNNTGDKTIYGELKGTRCWLLEMSGNLTGVSFVFESHQRMQQQPMLALGKLYQLVSSSQSATTLHFGATFSWFHFDALQVRPIRVQLRWKLDRTNLQRLQARHHWSQVREGDQHVRQPNQSMLEQWRLHWKLNELHL